jgi:hypothetical protein
MRSLKIALVLAGVVALLSVGFAQGKGDMDKGAAKKPAMAKSSMKGQSKMAKHHGKMMMKAKGHKMAAMAKHHGKMAKHHRMMRRHHKGHMMMKKGEAMEKKGAAMEKKGGK